MKPSLAASQHCLGVVGAKQARLHCRRPETEAELASFTPALLAKAFRGEL
jgi:hypothetical protein